RHPLNQRLGHDIAQPTPTTLESERMSPARVNARMNDDGQLSTQSTLTKEHCQSIVHLKPPSVLNTCHAAPCLAKTHLTETHLAWTAKPGLTATNLDLPRLPNHATTNPDIPD